MAELTSAIVDAIAPRIASPFAVFGHSLGALIGFELLHEIERRYGRSPLAFYASASRAPFLKFLSEPIHQLPDDEFLQKLQSRYAGIPAAVAADPAYMRSFIRHIRADFCLLEKYVYVDRPPLSCPILVVGGKDDLNVPLDSLMAWRILSSGPFDLKLLNAGHFYLRTNRAELIGLLSDHVRSLEMRDLDTAGCLAE